MSAPFASPQTQPTGRNLRQAPGSVRRVPLVCAGLFLIFTLAACVPSEWETTPSGPVDTSRQETEQGKDEGWFAVSGNTETVLSATGWLAIPTALGLLAVRLLATGGLVFAGGLLSLITADVIASNPWTKWVVVLLVVGVPVVLLITGVIEWKKFAKFRKKWRDRIPDWVPLPFGRKSSGESQSADQSGG